MKPICLDSHVYIWAIKEAASKGQEAMIQRAKNFLEHIEEQKIPVILPTPIVAELLSPVPPEQHEDFMKLINSKFRVVPFDTPASIKMAEIWHRKKSLEALENYRKEHRIARETMKLDFQIAAIAIVRGCDCIYSHDPHIGKFVGDDISVREIPNIGRQTKLDF